MARAATNLEKLGRELNSAARESCLINWKINDIFNQIRQELGSDLYRFFIKSLSSEQAANDCFVDLWTELVKSARNYNPNQNLRKYVYGIATNIWKTKLGEIRRQKENEEKAKEETLLKNTLNQENVAPPVAAAMSHELINAVYESLAFLGSTELNKFKAVLLNHCLKIPVREAAKALNTGDGTITENKNDGLRIIKSQIKMKHPEFEEDVIMKAVNDFLKGNF